MDIFKDSWSFYRISLDPEDYIQVKRAGQEDYMGGDVWFPSPPQEGTQFLFVSVPVMLDLDPLL